MIGELAPSQVEQLLHEQVIGRIGCQAGTRAYVVPITYYYDGESVYAHTGDGTKISMMRENPEVCFEVEDLHRLPRWSSVIAFGRFEELHGVAAQAALKQIKGRLTAEPPALEVMPRQGAGLVGPAHHEERPEVVFRIRLTEKSGRYDH